ncbi:MAG: hypothetical protein K5753_06620 [Clostridia bacterium]|nr:hypothetical protein [Clostridia bacterium]
MAIAEFGMCVYGIYLVGGRGKGWESPFEMWFTPQKAGYSAVILSILTAISAVVVLETEMTFLFFLPILFLLPFIAVTVYYLVKTLEKNRADSFAPAKKMEKDLDQDDSSFYQVEFNNHYGYFQKMGQVEKDGHVSYFRIIFEKVYSSPITDISVLQESAKYIAHSDMGIQEEVEFNQQNYSYNIKKLLSEKEKKQLGLNQIYYASWDNSKNTVCQGFAKISRIAKCKPLVEYEIPQMVRTIDFNFITYSYKWVVMTPFRKLVKVQKTCKGIEHLPPMGQSIALTINRWAEGIGEKDWNDEYCKRVIERNRKEDQASQEVLSVSPIEKWIEKHDEKEPFYLRMKECVEGFEKVAENLKSKKNDVRKELVCLVKNINELQTEEAFLETEESEAIIRYLTSLLSKRKYVDLMDVVDDLRDW